MKSYDTDIYNHCLGKDLDIEKFISNIDRSKYHKSSDYNWW